MRGCRNAIISPLLYSSIFGNHNIPPLRPSTTPIFRNCHCNSNYGYFSQKMADCFYSEVKPMGIKHEFSVCFFSGLNEEWQLPFQPKQLLPSVSNHLWNLIRFWRAEIKCSSKNTDTMVKKMGKDNADSYRVHMFNTFICGGGVEKLFSLTSAWCPFKAWALIQSII